MWQLLIVGYSVLQASAFKHYFESFQNPINGEFGLVDDDNVPCLVAKFQVRLYNFNLNGTDIATETADFTLKDVRLSGFCALHNEVTKKSRLQAVWSVGGRRRTLDFEFREWFDEFVGRPFDELRWKLHRVTYSQKVGTKSLSFHTLNDSNVVSAPIRQKFMCKDRLNITLHNSKYKDIVLELQPEIDFQPLNIASGYGSNVHVCERTRRRTLSESFQSQMTVFSGIVLGLSSMGTLIGYTVRRQLEPARRDFLNFAS